MIERKAAAGLLAGVLALGSLVPAGAKARSGPEVLVDTDMAAMVGIHLLIGLGEGVISALVFLAIVRARPELVGEGSRVAGRSRVGSVVGFGLVVSLGLAIFVAPFACRWPDGLESVAARLGFEHRGGAVLPAPLADYALPGCKLPAMGTAVAGAVGALMVFGLALLLSRVLVPKGSEAVEG